MYIFRFVENSTFVEKYKREQQPNYISIAKLKGCYSMGVGMFPGYGGKHQVSIGKGCAFIGVVIHELMHAIGTK